MKRKKYLFIVVSTTILMSCNKVLDIEPTDFLSPVNYFETEEQLNFARAGVYNNLGATQLYGAWANYALGWEGDIAYLNAAALTSGPYNFFYSSSDPFVLGVWSNLYNGIERANVVLANVDKNPRISQALRDRVRGEVLFLRAYYYFLLVRNYGGVPLKITPTLSITNVNTPKASVQEVYHQIIDDMEQAEPLVPGIETLGYGGAVSKSAVRGLLARVNLHMAGEPLRDVTRYAEVRKWCKMIMEDANAGHSLNPSYPEIFMNLAGDRYDIRESIWEVEFWGNRMDQYVETSNNGYINGPVSGANNVNTGRAVGYYSITSKYYDVFEPGDDRKWWDIAHFTYPNTVIPAPNGTKTLTGLPANQAAKNILRTAKFRREYETYLPKNQTNTPQNIPLLRFSDILLMFAEAENELNNGPSQEAIEAVNKVRRRAWTKGIKSIQVTNGGTGYTSAPQISFTGGGGTGASATAVISAGRVTAINLNRDPDGIKFYQDGAYTSVPSVVISGGGGSGASAIAMIYTAIDAELSVSSTSSKERFLESIQDERMREFGCENMRKFDLLRWGIMLDVYKDLANRLQLESPGQFFGSRYGNATERDVFMPIPITEVTTNLLMEQNPGWN